MSKNLKKFGQTLNLHDFQIIQHIWGGGGGDLTFKRDHSLEVFIMDLWELYRSIGSSPEWSTTDSVLFQDGALQIP